MAGVKNTTAAGSLDEESKAMIHHGLNMSQLCQLFKMDHRTLVAKMEQGEVKPSGRRGGYPVYFVHEVAPWVIKPAYDVEEHLKRMNPADLPKMLHKEFWAGQRARQEYELREGNLWPTEVVYEKVGELVKLVKMSTNLMADAVERQTQLTDRQRSLIKSMCDGMLRELSQAVLKHFKEKPNGRPQEDSDEDI